MKRLALILVLLPSLAWCQRSYTINSGSPQQTMRGIYLEQPSAGQTQSLPAGGCLLIPSAVNTSIINDMVDMGYTGARRPMWWNHTLPQMRLENTNDNSDPNVFAGLNPYNDAVWGFDGGDVDCNVATSTTITNWLLPFRSAVGSNFELYTDFIPGAFTSMRSFWQSDPNEGAEMTVAFAVWFNSVAGFYPNFYAWNEPDFGYFGTSKWMGNWAKDVGNRMNALNSAGTGVAMVSEFLTPDSGALSQLNNAISAFSSSAVAGQYMKRCSFHDYDYKNIPYPTASEITDRNNLRSACQGIGAELESTEGGDWNSNVGIGGNSGLYEGGLAYWRNWFVDMTEANASVVAHYNSRWVCAGGATGVCPNSSGGPPVILQTDNFNTYWLFPNYWVMRQFGHYVKPGYVRLAATCSNCSTASLPDFSGTSQPAGPDMKCMAFKRPDTTMVLTCLNDTGSTQALTLTGMNSGTYNLHKLDASMCTGTAKNRCTPVDSTVTNPTTLSAMPANAVWTLEQQSAPTVTPATWLTGITLSGAVVK